MCTGDPTSVLTQQRDDAATTQLPLQLSFTPHCFHGYKTEESLKWDGYSAQETCLFPPSLLFFFSILSSPFFFFAFFQRYDVLHAALGWTGSSSIKYKAWRILQS